MNTIKRLIALANVQHQVHVKEFNSKYGVEVCMRSTDCKDASVYWNIQTHMYFKGDK